MKTFWTLALSALAGLATMAPASAEDPFLSTQDNGCAGEECPGPFFGNEQVVALGAAAVAAGIILANGGNGTSTSTSTSTSSSAAPSP